VELVGETLAALGVEDRLGEEGQDAVEEVVLADVDAGWMAGPACGAARTAGIDGPAM
jgi:hypothetical protein